MQIKNPDKKPCSIEGCNSTYIARAKDWICNYHLQQEYNKKSIQGRINWNRRNRKPIRQVSRKREIENRIYLKKRKEFLSLPENRICFISECPDIATTIEHTRGRVGSLFLDIRFWKPCCWFHNGELERDPELSKKYQLSKLHGGKKD